MAHDDNFTTVIKMEIDIDDNDFMVYKEFEDSKDFIIDKMADPLLSLTPIVYTTKLDDMNTIKLDLTQLKANEILEKLQSESKPTSRTKNINHFKKSKNVESFKKLSNVISDMNYKVNLQKFPNAAISPNSCPGSDATKKNKPCYVVLEDIKQLIPENQTVKVDANHRIINFTERETKVQDKAYQDDNKPNDLESDIHIVLFGSPTSQIRNTNILETSCSETNDSVPTSENQTIKVEPHHSIIDKVHDKGYQDAYESRDPESDTHIVLFGRPTSQIRNTKILETSCSETNDSVPTSENQTIKVEPHHSIIDKVHDKGYQAAYKSGEPESDIDIVSYDNQIRNTRMIETPDLDSNDSVPTNLRSSSREKLQKQNTKTEKIPAEQQESKNNGINITSVNKNSKLPKRKRKLRKVCETSSDDYEVSSDEYEVTADNNDTSSDDYDSSSDDYAPISNIRKKYKTSKNPVSTTVSSSVSKIVPKMISSSNIVSNKVSETANVTIVSNDLAQTSILDKYCLIVLLHDEKSFVYRVNPTKLVTDFYITEGYDYYKLASMYPRDEKIIEQYCCWYKRQEVIHRLCSRKNYPFTMQKFLKMSHTCHPDECRCCCQTSTDTNQYKLKEKRAIVNKSLTLADNWIQGLLNKTKLSTGLVNKALTYTPKVVKEKLLEKQSKEYIDNFILFLKNSNSNVNHELYEIGQNGNILRSWFVKKEEEVARIRRTYQSTAMLVRYADLCCWFKRQELIHQLKILKTTPATLKHIQIAHSCNFQECFCCCKPPLVALRAVEILPSTFKHTTAYERTQRPLIIRFDAKSNNAMLKVSKSKKNVKTAGASTAAVVLAGCASKDDNPVLSISILSKFKNLKLGINNCGQIEVVINGPAKNLSVAELKVLSDILALSTKLVDELGLSAEEFCNRINSKSEIFPATVPETLRKSTEDTAPETLRKSTDDTAPPPLEDHSDDNEIIAVENLKEEIITIEDDDDDVPVPAVPNETFATDGTVRNMSSPNLLTHTSPVQTPRTIYPAKSVAYSGVLQSISNLMEVKHKTYFDSFRLFFDNSDLSSDIVLPNVDKFTPLSNSVSSLLQAPSPMPIIKETFTLSDSSTEESTDAIPGPSGVTQRRGRNIVAIIQEDLSVTNDMSNQAQTVTTNSIITKRKLPQDINTQVNKKIRVKAPSELNAPNLQTSPGTKSIPIAPWPAPIMIKRDPHTNIQQIVRAVHTTATSPNPNMPDQTYVVANNITLPSNMKVVKPAPVTVSKLFQINEKVENVGGLRYLTLAPCNNPNIDKTSQKTLLAKILRAPQAKPTATSTGRCLVPPLVPIWTTVTSVPALPTKKTGQTEDQEEFINCRDRQNSK